VISLWCPPSNFVLARVAVGLAQIEKHHSCTQSVGSTSKCNKVSCGDGQIQESHDKLVNEFCDDGNSVGGDGCDEQCSVLMPSSLSAHEVSATILRCRFTDLL